MEKPKETIDMVLKLAGLTPSHLNYDAAVKFMEIRQKEEALARRERIATAVLTGVLVGTDGGEWSAPDASLHALRYADALIAALDKEAL